MTKLHLYYGTVKFATDGRHFMAWASSREHALDLVEAALTVDQPVQGSVVGPIASLRADVMRPGVFVEVPTAPARSTPAAGRGGSSSCSSRCFAASGAEVVLGRLGGRGSERGRADRSGLPVARWAIADSEL